MASGSRKESKVIDGLIDFVNNYVTFADEYTKYRALTQELDRAVAEDNIAISLLSNSVDGNNFNIKAIEISYVKSIDD